MSSAFVTGVLHPGAMGATVAASCSGTVLWVGEGRSALEPRVLGGGPGTASALKMAYAAWTKGSSALLAVVAALASAEDVADDLFAEWELSQPGVTRRLAVTAAEIAPRAWRWTGEMDEIAATFAAAGLPDGFHRAAGEVYERLRAFKDTPGTTVEEMLEALRRR